MDSIKGHRGIAAPYPATDVNTDLLYPQQFLRKPDRAQMGDFLFHSLRYRPDGSRHPHSWSIVDNGELVEWLLGL